MRWRLVSVTACSALLVACGGGGAQRLDPERAAALAARAERIATDAGAGRTCAAARAARILQQDLIAEVNERHVPDGLQEGLLADSNELIARLPCPGRVRPAAAVVARRLARRMREASG
jgi:hypothetical protein